MAEAELPWGEDSLRTDEDEESAKEEEAVVTPAEHISAFPA